VNPQIYFDVKQVNFVSIEHMSASKNVIDKQKRNIFGLFSGDLDCSDSSDEENCNDSTKKSIFSVSFHHDHTCINGYRCAQQRHRLHTIHSLCIPLNELCDGIYQCPLGDDEHHGRCRKARRRISRDENKSFLCLGNCTNCDLKSSFCEIINRIPTCQCRNGYIKIANG